MRGDALCWQGKKPPSEADICTVKGPEGRDGTSRLVCAGERVRNEPFGFFVLWGGTADRRVINWYCIICTTMMLVLLRC